MTIHGIVSRFSKAFSRAVSYLPGFAFIRETAGTQTPATLQDWINQNIFGYNRGVYWPVHPTSRVVNSKNIKIGIETSPGLMPGCYIQGLGKIEIGDYTQIGPNVGMISANHELTDNRKHILKKITIGKYCWIGMGAVILPGVTLGDYTIVGANSVVTKSFPEGYCVIAGSPAKVVKTINPAECVLHVSQHEYHGYIPKAKFPEFAAKHLKV